MAKPNKKGKGPKPAKGPKGFNEDALEQLTSKIDKNLGGKGQAPAKGKGNANGNDHKRKNPPTNESANQDRKRQRNSGGAPPKASPKAAKGIDPSVQSLLDEIRELGGDEEDLKLIEGLEDDDEEEVVKHGKESVDKKLRDELAAFSKELGFADHQPAEASEDEEVEEAEEEDEDEEEDDEDEEDDVAEEDVDDDDEEEDEAAIEDAPRKVGNMTFEPRADWHATKLPKLPSPAVDHVAPFVGAIENLKKHASTLLEDDAAKYRTSIFASSSHKFLSTIMTSGTLNDKVSALTLAIQESPAHNIRAFDALMNLASKKSRAQAVGAIGALVDLLGRGSVLPSDRRLRTFANQPGLIGTLQKTSIKQWHPNQPLPGKMTEMHLISWAYEEWLKDTYFKILQLLEAWSSDEIEYSRSRALDFVYGLLKDKPEQETNLLRLLVNKLGDRDRKIASRASYLLLQLQTSHPGMKPIVIRMVEQEILLHPSQDQRSKYYAVNTLNQTILSSKEPKVAESLMQVYFELFVTVLKTGKLGIGPQTDGPKSKPEEADKKPEEGSKPGKPGKGGKTFKKGPPKGDDKANEQDVEAADKLVSAVLTGVNRAAPFVGENDAIMEKHMDTLFKIAHSANFNTGIQALLLIQHLSAARSLGTDRFYRILYESLLDPRLITSSKQSLYLNLLLRALKNDIDVRRVKAFAKRMLQVSHLHQPAFVCGLLYVVSHLRTTFPDLATLIEEPEESIFDDDEEHRPVYDGRKRDPEYSNAQRSCLWEMIPVQAHFHPSVSVIASALVDKEQKATKPDLDSHSLIRFLDKFVYKNPKTAETARGVSIMQPLKATKDSGDIWLRTSGSGPATVNSASFINKKSEDIAAEDAFFHTYFQHMAKEPKKPKSAAAGGEDEEDAEEDEIWKALVNSRPDVDGDGADSEGFDDLDEDEMASDDDDDEIPDMDDLGDSDEDMVDIEGSDGEVDIESSDGGVDIEGSDDDDEDVAAADGLVAVEDEDEEKEETLNDKRKAHRKKIKSLPMFASTDDYAEMLEQEEDGIF